VRVLSWRGASLGQGGKAGVERTGVRGWKQGAAGVARGTGKRGRAALGALARDGAEEKEETGGGRRGKRKKKRKRKRGEKKRKKEKKEKKMRGEREREKKERAVAGFAPRSRRPVGHARRRVRVHGRSRHAGRGRTV